MGGGDSNAVERGCMYCVLSRMSGEGYKQGQWGVVCAFSGRVWRAAGTAGHKGVIGCVSMIGDMSGEVLSSARKI